MDATPSPSPEESAPEPLPREAVAAILLAAGASQRMGAVKALLALEDGAPAVCRLASLYEQCCAACVVVTGYHAERVEAALAACGHGIAVRNPAPEQGQLSSLQCGLRAVATLAPQAKWVLFAPVDCFDVNEGVLEALLGAMAGAGPQTLLCIPEADGKHGHPVAVRRDLAEEFLELPLTETARTVVHRHRERTCFVPVPDRGLLADYDTPEEFSARGKQPGRMA
jgi:CTP:molybdopterin cytidylyltransferase MocA